MEHCTCFATVNSGAPKFNNVSDKIVAIVRIASSWTYGNEELTMKRHYVGKMHPHHLDKTETGNFEQV
jgi:hypothetical protein